MSNNSSNTINSSVYKPRNPKTSRYYQCVSDHFEMLESVWEERYERQYGFFRPWIKNVIYRYLDCGDLHCGFARVKCKGCGHEYLLAFSCKRRHFCPSCHQKRVIEFGEWLCADVLKFVPHRQWVFSIPKRLRIYFMFDRKLLPKFSRCVWKVLSTYLKKSTSDDSATPGAVISVQTFGDFQNFNPHLHIIATDGCFSGNDLFQVGYSPNPKDLEELFRYEILKMLKKEEKITDVVIENMLSWHHSGFNIYCGPTIWPHDEDALENPARYIVRASFSQERMTYIPADQSPEGEARVIYQSKDGTTTKTFHALDWLARLTTHIPNKNEQMARYYGFYSNKSRGMRKKAENAEELPALIHTDPGRKQFRRNRARLIQKIYEVDPLTCPKCNDEMKIIAFIEQPLIIKKILKHLNLRETHNHDPPKKPAGEIRQIVYDDTYSLSPSF
jgi:hypothetical protein